MLQPRSLVLAQRCLSCVDPVVAVSRRFLSVSRRMLQDPLRSSIFIPAAQSTRTSFKDSPIKPVLAEDISVYNSPSRITIDNVRQFEKSTLPQTGPNSGRTVSCRRPGEIGPALNKLNRILLDNRVRYESVKSQTRLKPSDARRQRRSKQHRVRFNQGISRLVGIVLQMRKKAY